MDTHVAAFHGAWLPVRATRTMGRGASARRAKFSRIDMQRQGPEVGSGSSRSALPYDDNGCIAAADEVADGETTLSSTSTRTTTKKATPLLTAAFLTAAVTATHAGPASASEYRRQHRRLQTESALDRALLKNDRRKRRKKEGERAKKAREEQEELDRAIKEAKLKDDVLLQSVESIKHAISTSMPKNSPAPKYSVSARGRPAPSAVYGSIRQRDSPLPAGMGILWGIAGVTMFMYLKNKFGWSFGKLWGGRQTGATGRWVRDRSLGGKMVYIEDTKKPSAPRPLWDDLPGEEEAQKKRTVPGYLSGSDDYEGSGVPGQQRKMAPVRRLNAGPSLVRPCTLASLSHSLLSDDNRRTTGVVGATAAGQVRQQGQAR